MEEQQEIAYAKDLGMCNREAGGRCGAEGSSP